MRWIDDLERVRLCRSGLLHGVVRFTDAGNCIQEIVWAYEVSLAELYLHGRDADQRVFIVCALCRDTHGQDVPRLSVQATWIAEDDTGFMDPPEILKHGTGSFASFHRVVEALPTNPSLLLSKLCEASLMASVR
ncbi:MAG: hypothetical protein QG626_768 [Patescibacteria group bacterium]|jgi:hypothetical protein|nr:hypothetical protein [Patescibacteria group bacterium]